MHVRVLVHVPWRVRANKYCLFIPWRVYFHPTPKSIHAARTKHADPHKKTTRCQSKNNKENKTHAPNSASASASLSLSLEMPLLDALSYRDHRRRLRNTSRPPTADAATLASLLAAHRRHAHQPDSLSGTASPRLQTLTLAPAEMLASGWALPPDEEALGVASRPRKRPLP
jgi:hypothetical protein